MKLAISVALLSIHALIAGCAFDVMTIEQQPARLSSADSCAADLVLAKGVRLDLRGGYSRTLKQGTRWRCIGRLPQGEVYRTSDQVLTVELSNIYEAAIVVSARRVVGFYLPVERTFTPLDGAVTLPIE